MSSSTCPTRQGSSVTVVLPNQALAAHTARGCVADHLRRLRVRDDRVDEAMLVVSELVTNAVCHAEGGAAIVVDCTVDDSEVEVAVADGGAVTALEPMHASPRDTSGRGLAIVDVLATRWWVELGVAGTTVHAVLPVG